MDGLPPESGESGSLARIEAAPLPAEAPPVPGAAASAPVLSAYEPALRLYLLAVATCGLALVWQADRIGRMLDPEVRRDRVRRVVWALSALFPPMASAQLYETARLARLELVRLGVRPRAASLWIPPVIQIVIWFALAAMAFDAMIGPLAILGPVPYLLAQTDVNEFELVRAARAGHPVPTGDRRRWLALVLLPATAFGLFLLDRPAFREARSARRLVAGSVVEDATARLSLTVPEDGWQQVAAGVVGDGDEELGLRRTDGSGWLLVHCDRRASEDLDLDGIADERRRQIKAAVTLSEVSERREFLADATLVPVAFTRHSVGPLGVLGRYFTAAVVVDEYAIEVIGYGLPRATDGIERLVASVRLRAPVSEKEASR